MIDDVFILDSFTKDIDLFAKFNFAHEWALLLPALTPFHRLLGEVASDIAIGEGGLGFDLSAGRYFCDIFPEFA